MNENFEKMSAEELIKWAVEKYGEKVALASSFGAEDVVLIDMLVKINPKAKIFTLDTGRLNQETYEVMDAISEKYGITFDIYFPPQEKVEKMEKEHGVNLFYKSMENRKTCCNIRKVEGLNRALKNLHSWITGLRREQAVTRGELQKVEIWNRDFSPVNNRVKEDNETKVSTPVSTPIAKINPLADWTEYDVWDYIKKNNVPYNALHDKGYPSIGCAPCTRTIKEGEDVRAGRWWWETPEQKECGLHIKCEEKKNGSTGI